MKAYIVCSILFFILCNVCLASINTGSVITTPDIPHSGNKPVTYKVVLHLMNHKKLKATATQFYDTAVLVSMHNRDVDTAVNINANNIYKIKIRRKAFLTGAEFGMASGFVAGVLVILVCNKDTSVTTFEIISGLILGIPAAIPGAVMGSIINTIITKRNFEIDGDRKKFKAMHVRLQKWKIFSDDIHMSVALIKLQAKY